MKDTFLLNFNKNTFSGIDKAIEEYGLFEYTLSPSSDITERDFCMVVSDYFVKQKYNYQMEFSLGNKKIDFFIHHERGQRHYIEIKDCGIYETKYAKSLTYSKEVEDGTYDSNKPYNLTFAENHRAKSKTNWLEYFQRNERKGGRTIGGSEGLAKDIYKFYKLYNQGFLNEGNICTCIAFVFWPQPFPGLKKKHFANIKYGEKTIKLGTQILLEQLEKQSFFGINEYIIKTIPLPKIRILDPYDGDINLFNASDIKLTIELLSWFIE